MAIKCVAQIPHPVAAPAVTIHAARPRPVVDWAQRNRLIAVMLARKHTKAARRTSRQSCSTARQVSILNILYASSPYPNLLTKLILLRVKTRMQRESSLGFSYGITGRGSADFLPALSNPWRAPKAPHGRFSPSGRPWLRDPILYKT